MSYLLTQIEMESSLQEDYQSIIQATKNMSNELLKSITEFEEKERAVSHIKQRHSVP